VVVIVCALACGKGGGDDAKWELWARLHAQQRFVDASLSAGQFQAWNSLANEGKLDELSSLLSDSFVTTTGDALASVVSTRDEWIAQRKAMGTRSSCAVQLLMAGPRRAVGIRHCDGMLAANPKAQRRRTRWLQAFEGQLDPHGAISSLVLWEDLFRRVAQVGVVVDRTSADPDLPWPAPVVVLARGDDTEAANEKVARAFVGILASKDTEAIDGLVAPGLIWHDTARPRASVFDTPAAYGKRLAKDLAVFEPSLVTVHDAFAAENWVAIRFTHSYRRARALRRHRATRGREASASNLWLLRFDGGAIVEGWAFRGRYAELFQLGAIDSGELVSRMNAVR